MKFVGDLSGYQVAVIKDLPLVAGAYVQGALLTASTTADLMYAQVGSPTYADIIGLYDGPSQTAAGTVAAGTITYGKVIINPNGVYRAEYDKDAQITCTNYAAGTWTVTHDGQAGGWIWSATSTDSDYGLLMYAGSVVASTSISSVAAPTAATPTTTDDLIYIHPGLTGPGAAAQMEIDLTADATEILTDGTYTGTGLAVIESYTYGDGVGGYQPLRFASHNDTVNTSYRFFSDITPIDHALNQKI
jgi:hypothetical protein